MSDLVRISLDAEVCIGVGQCELLEPTVFVLDDDEGISMLVGSAHLVPERAELVVNRCPSGAIRIAEDASPMGLESTQIPDG